MYFTGNEGRKEPDTMYPVGNDGGQDRILLDTGTLVKRIILEKLDGADSDFLAYSFHRELAFMVVQACQEIREKTGRNVAALSGGVFQNTLFLGLCKRGLENEGFQVLHHHLIPPNDGGISLGQALYAAYHCFDAS